MTNEILQTLFHVIQTPYFWSAMGYVTACAIFIGAAICNGDLRIISKVIVSILIYAMFVGWVSVSNIRVLENREFGTWMQPIIILAVIAAAYVVGLFLGICISRFIYRK